MKGVPSHTDDKHEVMTNDEKFFMDCPSNTSEVNEVIIECLESPDCIHEVNESKTSI